MDKKLKAIVTRAVPYNESDMILTLVSPEEGRLTASARGCLKSSAKLRYAAQPMNFGEYMLSGKGDRYIVTDCVQIESFSPVTLQIDKYYAASLILETLAKLSPEPHPQLFVHAVKELSELAYSDKEGADSICDFLLGALALCGYDLDFKHCNICKCDLDGEAAYMQADGIVCTHCAGLEAVKFDSVTRAFIAGENREIDNIFKTKANMMLCEIVYSVLGVSISRHYFLEHL